MFQMYGTWEELKLNAWLDTLKPFSYKEQVKGWSGIRPPLRISLLQQYIT